MPFPQFGTILAHPSPRQIRPGDPVRFDWQLAGPPGFETQVQGAPCVKHCIVCKSQWSAFRLRSGVCWVVSLCWERGEKTYLLGRATADNLELLGHAHFEQGGKTLGLVADVHGARVGLRVAGLW
jgi:hypothetical protein